MAGSLTPMSALAVTLCALTDAAGISLLVRRLRRIRRDQARFAICSQIRRMHHRQAAWRCGWLDEHPGGTVVGQFHRRVAGHQTSALARSVPPGGVPGAGAVGRVAAESRTEEALPMISARRGREVVSAPAGGRLLIAIPTTKQGALRVDMPTF